LACQGNKKGCNSNCSNENPTANSRFNRREFFTSQKKRKITEESEGNDGEGDRGRKIKDNSIMGDFENKEDFKPVLNTEKNY
jgi:hypothetical protein